MQPFPFTPWTWRDPTWTTDRDRGADPSTDPADAAADRTDTGLVGYHVEATDGGIGKVDRAAAEVPADCLVVDTGPWIFGQKVVLPVGTVERVDHRERTIHVDRTKEQIRNAPGYDPGGADHESYRHLVGDYYTESYRLVPPML
ncbi:PRC-barrel domain containing protein [Saccharothrix algeriensis]|uniref:PRC-barrel domain containing protein n=1 Tax=Saccharothrix algeriensis TaxID=173560 RepID=A0A8T8HYG7_9PSEU|nr:PRC-barrel domain containing protein [Saccharothrix algeriensis]MBM7815192.1 hypothetical protein [Saccharothrix algeriensis]QTR03429.1 PRC-barrel domain containing protein [Saccharothrix algeriensis]